jgi:hypothetical protein
MMIPTTKAIESVAPIAIIGSTLLILLFVPVPIPNKDFINVILAGLLGYLSKSRNDSSAAVQVDPPATVMVEEPKP